MALYPPIVASSMPAFDVTNNLVRIYYSLSNYNAIHRSEINGVQVSVRRQSSNVNVLKNKSLIVNKSFEYDEDSNRYFIDIDQDADLKNHFEVDALYKVQLRFTNSTDNIDFASSISEWSTVCIIKPVNPPFFYIDEFYVRGQGKTKPKELDENHLYSILADFVGVYEQLDSSLVLRSWRLRLLTHTYTPDNIKLINDYTLSDSGWVLNSVSNYNLDSSSAVFACSLPYELRSDSTYKLFFEILTKNGYTDSVLYSFTCENQNINTLSGLLSTYINELLGYIKVDFQSTLSEMCNLVLRRSTEESGFNSWLDLKFMLSYGNPNFTYYDFTVQSGTFYRYLVQKVDSRGRKGTPVYDLTRTPGTGTMGEWEHAFLLESTGNGSISGTKQLKLKYDFQISSYKTNISESKTDTIGSKYPFIRRSGNMYYRSFPVTGTITGYMDENDIFTNSNLLFYNKYNEYQNFKGNIDEYVNRYDYTYERRFREKVELFLYNSKPKLYKSMQEGNILVKLMEVSLTPKSLLGRLIYTFSATAYEIDLPSISNFDKYGFIYVGQFNPNMLKKDTVFGQLTKMGDLSLPASITFKAGLNIIGASLDWPAAQYNIARDIKFGLSINRQVVTDFTLNWIRLTIESDPYLIVEYPDGPAGNYRPLADINDSIDFTGDLSGDPITRLYQMESTYLQNNSDLNIYLGWLFNINGQTIIVAPPNNIYLIKEEGFSIPWNGYIVPAKDTTMSVDYRLINVVKEDLTLVPKNIRTHKVNGQLIGVYSENQEIIGNIYYKYRYNYKTSSEDIRRSVARVNTILIDTLPRTVVYFQTTAMDLPERFVVNDTGLLNFDPDAQTVNVSISYLKIIGSNFFILSFNDHQDSPIESLDLVEFPKHMDLYKLTNGKLYCFYNAQWRKVDKILTEVLDVYTYDVYCPTEAMIFYYISVKEDIY